MKKILVFLVAAICYCFTATANTDTNGVIVRGEGNLAQYKKALSSEGTGKIGRAINSAAGGGVIMLDLTLDVYDFYDLTLTDNGPSDGKILAYINNNLDKSVYDYHITFIYDIFQLDGKTYVELRALAPNGLEIANADAKGLAENLDQLIELFASATSSMIKEINNLK